MKKTFIMIMTILFVSLLINGQKVLANEISTEYEFLNDNYVANELLVTLNEESSLSYKEYNANSFAEVECVEVQDLTSAYKEKVMLQLKG